MGQITATRNLVAIKVVRHAGQWQGSHCQSIFQYKTGLLFCHTVKTRRNRYWELGMILFASCNNEMSWSLIEISWICVVKLLKSEITQTQICLLHLQNPENERQPINILWNFSGYMMGYVLFFKSNTAIIFHFFKSYFLRLCRMQNFHFSFFTFHARILFRISVWYEINRCFISRLLEIQICIYPCVYFVAAQHVHIMLTCAWLHYPQTHLSFLMLSHIAFGTFFWLNTVTTHTF